MEVSDLKRRQKTTLWYSLICNPLFAEHTGLPSQEINLARGDRCGMSQSTLSRAMQAVWDGISDRYSNFPYSAVEQVNIKLQFLVRASFPNVMHDAIT